MIKAADLPETIPVFPLPGALMLPRSRCRCTSSSRANLAMIDDCLKTKSRLIGMIQPRETPATERKAGERRLQAIGCAGRLTGFSETEDGRYMITLSGCSRFRVKDEVQGFTPIGAATWTGSPSPAIFRARKRWTRGLTARRSLRSLGRYLTTMNLSTDWDSLKEAETELLINSLSMLCPFSAEDKQALLEAPSLTTRRETLVTLIEFALRGRRR